MSEPTDTDLTFQARVEDTVAILESIHSDRALLAELDPVLRRRLLISAGQVSRPLRKARKAQARAHQRKDREAARERDAALLNQTGIRQLRENPIFLTPRRQAIHNGLPLPALPPPPTLGETEKARTCYVCRKEYTGVHFFYDQMCPTCGDFNYAKRTQTADLRGRVALVTGARVKIGYQAAILMLRAGAEVIVLTRFPRDAARRYAAEEDFESWGDRLEIHGIDLRHIPNVEALCERLLATHDRLDFIINNACQTVRRPPGYYDHLMGLELEGTPAAAQLSDREAALVVSGDAVVDAAMPSASFSQIPLAPGDEDRSEKLFPTGTLDADLQQVDLRKVNSWRLMMDEVPTIELLEVQLVNAVAPFVLNARLKPLMARVPTRDKHIVNVSAMEGQFYRTFKTARHPHTNMAKASLNMMTRTAALDYIEDGIHMNSVDTGWVTDEDPIHHAERKRAVHDFHPPLDIVDGAARIVDPILHGINTGEHVWGQFLKDYTVTDW
ncbi:MAG: SDR family oxidoreductase [Myxococcota bacterium]|nr:SDR family oxidoreductase [Myxococcota bacterium]